MREVITFRQLFQDILLKGEPDSPYTATYTLVHQRYFILQEMRIGMMNSHPRALETF